MWELLAGLGMARRDEAVFNVLLVADPLEAMLTRQFPLTGRAEPVGEFQSVRRAHAQSQPAEGVGSVAVSNSIRP